jgi:hypothetical protein
MSTEKLIYRSPKKHRIIALKDFLEKNNIPITSIKLNICLRNRFPVVNRRGSITSHNLNVYIRNGDAGTVQMEKSDEIHIPIEDFNEELNDAQSFELYTDEEHEETARGIMENCDEETFFGDCIFSSIDYEETFDIFMLLKKNNIPCSDVHTIFTEDNGEKYLLFTDPENMDAATKIMNRIERYETETEIYEKTKVKKNELFNNEHHENNIFKFLIPVVTIFCCLFLFKINNESIIGIIIRKIGAILAALTGTGYIGE